MKCTRWSLYKEIFYSNLYFLYTSKVKLTSFGKKSELPNQYASVAHTLLTLWDVVTVGIPRVPNLLFL